jgi:hypothetical protein
LRIHHADGAPQHAVKHVKGIAVDIEVDRQPFNAVNFCETVFGFGDTPITTISASSILPLTFFT